MTLSATVIVPSMAQAQLPETAANNDLPSSSLPWKGLNSPAGEALQACVDRARMEATVWTCMGGSLTTVDEDGTVVTKVVATDTKDTTGEIADSMLLANDYDTWCEYTSVCTRKINDYISEVKGNGAYGDITGAIGEFDFIVRQAFDGQWPRWRNTFIWDGGPTITPQGFTNNCRINKTGPDGYCGQNPFNFGIVSSVNQQSWKPNTTGYYYNSSKTTGTSKYHDDHYGTFTAAGYNYTFHVGTIHTGRWNQCDSLPYCRYYQVPWA